MMLALASSSPSNTRFPMENQHLEMSPQKKPNMYVEIANDERTAQEKPLRSKQTKTCLETPCCVSSPVKQPSSFCPAPPKNPTKETHIYNSESEQRQRKMCKQ